jgi:hypothetical protein
LKAMSIGHRDVMIQLVHEYQSLNDAHIEYRHCPTALDFSRIVKSNRPVVFTGIFLQVADEIPFRIGPR